MKKIVFILGCLLMDHVSMAQKKEFSWLIGTWKLEKKNEYEIWKVNKDGKTLEGTSFLIKEKDTIVQEQIRFTHAQNTFHYIPDVPGNKSPIDFMVTHHDGSSFVAENPKHDFPKIIRYRLIGRENKNFIEASIEGNGKVISYRFERVK